MWRPPRRRGLANRLRVHPGGAPRNESEQGSGPCSITLMSLSGARAGSGWPPGWRHPPRHSPRHSPRRDPLISSAQIAAIDLCPGTDEPGSTRNHHPRDHQDRPHNPDPPRKRQGKRTIRHAQQCKTSCSGPISEASLVLCFRRRHRSAHAPEAEPIWHSGRQC